ncbi:MAG: acireductone synthase [Pseudohongiellaceae bacterium]|nr:MAG: 2,3-diketo-5-methylthio-1-phosphopentane phosphatase [Gammaproteobacteria bacterium RIFCSPLOWO2_02_FULL_57_10]
MKIAAIVTDIEGTTSGIGFVHDVLFPYALKHVAGFVREHQEERDVMRVLLRISEKTGIPLHDIEGMIRQLQQWIRDDEKITELKTLQGMIWEKGYKQGLFQAHIYDDVPEQLQRWQQEERNLYVFSSGSVKAQQLFFRYSIFGDMRLLFSGYYDTTIGPKREANSYRKIAEAIALKPQSILFLSDSREELDAAAEAGLRTTWVIRPQDTSLDPERVRLKSPHPVVTSFEQIHPD